MSEEPQKPETEGPADWRDLAPAAFGDDVAVSLAFLTRLPLRFGNAPFHRRPLSVAMRAFPVVGALIGLAGGLAFVLADWLGLPQLACAALAVAALVLITGALHEDALADMADGFGGGWSTEQKLDIMKDSRVGTYGLVAATLALLLKFSAIVGLDEAGGTGFVLLALVASGALSRAAIVALPHLLEPAKSAGLAAETGRPNEATVVQALIVAVVIALLTVPFVPALVAVTLALGATAGLGALASRQIGGQTGDVLGACQQAAEIAFLFGILMMV